MIFKKIDSMEDVGVICHYFGCFINYMIHSQLTFSSSSILKFMLNMNLS